MLRSYQKIDRRKTRIINVGNVPIGGNSPIAVQTMTNTITSDVKATLSQIKRVVESGVDLPSEHFNLFKGNKTKITRNK